MTSTTGYKGCVTSPAIAHAGLVPVARLIEHRPDRPARSHELPLGKHTIGRSIGVDINLDHVDVSRRHAELEITPDGATIRDLGSKNGVAIAGRKIQLAALDDGVRVSLGELGLVLDHPGARIGRILHRHGEPTVRRPRTPSLVAHSRATVLAPAIAAAVFALLLTLLVVFG
jgi:pSer/pThr/pTyr-binding forkhead associated (FHA) protein